MTEVIDLVRDWRLLLLVLLVFGVAPGAVLRVVVRLYPRGHPRREELIAELYAINFIARPLWVAQQLETATFEGLQARWHTNPEGLWYDIVTAVGLASMLAALVRRSAALLLLATTLAGLSLGYTVVFGPAGAIRRPQRPHSDVGLGVLVLFGAWYLWLAVYFPWRIGWSLPVLGILGICQILLGVAILILRRTAVLTRYIR